MSENLQAFTRALGILRSVAVRVPTDAWDHQSCCDEWTARQAAGHASWVLQSIASTASGSPGPAQQAEADVAGTDPAATLCSSIDGCLAALDRPGVLETISPTPFGEMPIDDFLGAVWVDPMTHAWDIADAVGIDHGIDPQTASDAHETIEPVAEMMRSGGMLGPEVETSSIDPVVRAMAFTGRTSMRT